MFIVCLIVTRNGVEVLFYVMFSLLGYFYKLHSILVGYINTVLYVLLILNEKKT